VRTIGLIGGMSWESTAAYYRLINEGVRDRLGPLASAQCVLWSFDFADIAALQRADEWEVLTDRLTDAARKLEVAGADLLLICTNTMHKMAPAVQAAVHVPLIHIANPTAEAIKAAGITRVGLLGTAFTMEHDFYKDKLARDHGLRVLVPDADDRAAVHRIIFDELVAGKVFEESRETYRCVIRRLVADGAQGVILGCTEIMLLIGSHDSHVPLFDTTALHAEAAVAMALAR
jgi:aspartate racemase